MLAQLIRKFHTAIHEQTSIAPLITVRIMLGLLLSISTIRFIVLGWIEDHYISPVFHFSYFGFEWLPRLGAVELYAIHGIMLLSSLAVLLGFYYRIASILLFLTFTYTELYDLTYYLNHYYFVSLACLFLLIVPAHRNISLDAWLNPKNQSSTVPNWTIWLFKGQIGIVYLCAGLAKINYSWLIEALPLRIWLPPNEHLPIIGSIFTWEYTPWIFSWAGMIFDISIPFLLLNKNFRPWAYLLVIVFHALTGILFQIGVFPLVMMGATLIFFSIEWHTRWQSVLIKMIHWKSMFSQSTYSVKFPGIISSLFILYFLFQILFPWRFALYPGSLFWTEEAYRFGWRVMLMEKAGTATFYVKDTCTGKEGTVFNKEFLNDHQEKQMAMQPDMILQYAHFLKDHYQQKGLCNPEVRAEVFVTLNGQPGRLLFDPHLNLSEIQDSWETKNWIYPYAIQ
jgi:hypothetical protein